MALKSLSVLLKEHLSKDAFTHIFYRKIKESQLSTPEWICNLSLRYYKRDQVWFYLKKQYMNTTLQQFYCIKGLDITWYRD